MGKFFTNKTCIYLDQFAVSNLSEDHTWEELLNLLKKGIENEKIVIPYSSDHLFESSHKDFDRAKEADRLLFQMSNGISLEITPILEAKLLISSIRKRPITKGIYTVKVAENIFESKDNYNFFKNLKTTFNQMSHESTVLVNQIRSITREGKKQDGNDQKNSIQRTASIYQKELENRLRKFSRYGFYDKKPIKFSMATIPFWADQIMDVLIREYRITKVEAKKGEEILKKYGLKNIVPPLYVRCALETMLAVKHQQETANDHFDIIRLSCAVPFADIVLTDKSKVFDIKSSFLDMDFNIKSYSGTQKDLLNLKSELSSLI